MINSLFEFLLKKESVDYYWKVRSKINESKNIFSRTYYKIVHKRLMLKHNSDISFKIPIANKPTFPHGINGIFISRKAIIGKNCTIFHQVTIGSNTLSSSKHCGAPRIGDNVYIGCGAKIIGGVNIGNNVRIGANCVVVEDIPDNSTVVLPKPRIITHDTARDNTFVRINEYDTKK